METQQEHDVLLFQTQCPGRRVGLCGAQVSHVTVGSACGLLCQREAVVQSVISAPGLWEQRDFYYGEMCWGRSNSIKKNHQTSPVPLCDSKIFREICALYAVGILKQGIGTSIIQKLEQDVWKRQIDSWFVPNLWLYVIHHCQA